MKIAQGGCVDAWRSRFEQDGAPKYLESDEFWWNLMKPVEINLIKLISWYFSKYLDLSLDSFKCLV